jgi:MerR family copper efflux transcriptional regulator
MRIGELAAQSGVTTKTIRFWETTGLLAEPARTPSGYRDYEPAALDRLSFIRHAQAAGLTLAEIRQVLAISDDGEPPCEHVTDLIHQHLLDVDKRIHELTETRSRLGRLAQRAANLDPADCDGYCAILEPAAHPRRSTPRQPIPEERVLGAGEAGSSTVEGSAHLQRPTRSTRHAEGPRAEASYGTSSPVSFLSAAGGGPVATSGMTAGRQWAASSRYRTAHS